MWVAAGAVVWGQAQTDPAPKMDRAAAYYYYSLAHLYADLASNSTNGRAVADYINKAIDNYKLAIKADPRSPIIPEELSEVYIGSGRFREAQSDAEETLRSNPNDLGAHRLLARIYTRQIGDSQQNKIDESMVKKAIAEYQKITTLDSKDADSLVMLGRLYQVSQNSVDAEKAYKQALEADPGSEDAMAGLAKVYSDLGNNKAAAEILQRLSAKNPSSRGLLALAASYEQMREFNLAAETLRKAIELNPPNVNEVKKDLARDLMFALQPQAALKVYQEIVEEEPNDAQSYLQMSHIYASLRDFAKAREAGEKAKSIDPNNLDVRYNDVSLLEAEGKTKEAIAALNAILDSTARKTYNAENRSARGMLLERLSALYRIAGQTQDAIDTLHKMGELDPENASKLVPLIIETYRGGKEYQKAEQEAEAAFKKWPNDRDVRAARATLLAELGKVDAAAADVKKHLDGKNDRETYLKLAEIYDKGRRFDEESKVLDAAEKLSESKEEKEGVWFTRGAMFEKQKKADAAEAEFRKVLEVNPDSGAALNYLGYMLADRNVRLPEALAMITKALEREPNNGAYLDSLGWVQFRLNRLADAEENLRRALALTPRDPTVHDHLGEVLMKQSKVKEAIAQWQASLKEWDLSSPADLEPAEVAKVKAKLENAKVRLAKEGGPKQ
jgi:tetratricopeptide (TPR) repeat protein